MMLKTRKMLDAWDKRKRWKMRKTWKRRKIGKRWKKAEKLEQMGRNK